MIIDCTSKSMIFFPSRKLGKGIKGRETVHIDLKGNSESRVVGADGDLIRHTLGRKFVGTHGE